MSATTALFAILAALLVGAMSPGPSFVLVSRIAVTQSRANGLAAALGMGVGGTFFAGLALLGLIALLDQVETLYLALKLAGGVYLVWLGIRMWRGSNRPLASSDGTVPRDRAASRALLFGLLTQLSNPKTAILYGAIFAALLPAAPPPWLVLTLPPLVFMVETGWYAIVALAFSATRPRAIYLRLKTALDRLTGLVMAGLGTRLIIEAVVVEGDTPIVMLLR